MKLDCYVQFTIHRKEKDNKLYIYLWCFVQKNSKRAYKNTKKNCKTFKRDESNAVSVGMIAIKPYLSVYLVGLGWFARYCGNWPQMLTLVSSGNPNLNSNKAGNS